MLKVMYIGHTAKLSGGELALMRLLSSLREKVDALVVLGEDGPLAGRLADLGVNVVVLPLAAETKDLRKDRLGNPLIAAARLAGVVSYAFRLRQVILRENVDLVHTNTLKAGFYGCLAARLAGVPSVWHLRDRLSPDYLPRLAIVATGIAMTVMPTRVVCNSQATLNALERGTYFRRRLRPVVMPSPLWDEIDLEKAADVPSSRDRKEFVVGMVGRLSPWKGQTVALEAFARARLKRPCRLVIIGSAMFGEEQYEQEIRATIKQLRIEQQVELRGFVEDVVSALREFDVLVHASTIPEPFGQVIVEGLAAGLPVVATRGGGPSEIITDGIDGLLYDPGDAEALAGLLQRLQEEAPLRRTLADRGQRRAGDFSVATVAPAMLEMYRALTSQTK